VNELDEFMRGPGPSRHGEESAFVVAERGSDTEVNLEAFVEPK